MAYCDNQNEKMKVRMAIGESIKLHQLGRFALDLNDILIFFDLLENERFEDLKNFHTGYRPPYHYPLVKEYEDIGDKFNIESIQKGSIELTLMGISTVAAIAMPIIIHKLRPKPPKEQPKPLVFEVETAYSNQIDNLLEHFSSSGTFDDQTLSLLIHALEINGYDVRWSDECKIVVVKTLDHYVKHTVRIFKLHNLDKA